MISLLNHKKLERDNDFLIYLSKTYRNMCLYLKGNLLILDSRRGGRDKDGKKKSRRGLLKMMSDDGGVMNFLKS